MITREQPGVLIFDEPASEEIVAATRKAPNCEQMQLTYSAEAYEDEGGTIRG